MGITGRPNQRKQKLDAQNRLHVQAAQTGKVIRLWAGGMAARGRDRFMVGARAVIRQSRRKEMDIAAIRHWGSGIMEIWERLACRRKV